MQYFRYFDMKTNTDISASEQDQKSQNTGPQSSPAIDLEAFAWTYSQKSGELDPDGNKVATGYSGAGSGKNNPELQNVHNVGPIPQGHWAITGPPADTKTHGPYVLRLTPELETETFGRSGFLMHGDSKERPGTASQGCIIVPRAVREQVWKSGDRNLKVVTGHPSDEGTQKGRG
jgi:Protein of unknown function (DUF2778)